MKFTEENLTGNYYNGVIEHLLLNEIEIGGTNGCH